GVREQMVRSQDEAHRLVSKAGVFAPKVPKDVLVTERFAPKSGLPTGIEAIYQMAKAAEAQAGGFASTVAARSRYVDGLIPQSRPEPAEGSRALRRIVAVAQPDRRAAGQPPHACRRPEGRRGARADRAGEREARTPI